ncbi:MAG: efflux RND transporter periplasmic adaptor subunit [Gammaproteobacteria bacterium]|nr:efflux RND transporter periplasmic adaptor subunit [Gammaproteobacteria bacterium]
MKRYFMNHAWLPMMVATLVIAGITGCSNPEETLIETTPETIQAELHTVATTDLASEYITSGIVTSDHRVAISSRLSGYIRGIKVREGTRVKKGDVLFRIDPVDAKQALAQAEADLADATSDRDRFKSLLSERAISQQQFDKTQLRYKVAESKVAQARNQLTYAEVRAPLSGVIVQKQMNSGDLASPGMPILVLEDPSHLLVETHISEQYLSDVQIGSSVELHIASIELPVIATVRQVVQAADAGSYQFLVKISLPSNKAIHPGMFAEVVFNVGQRQGLVVPESSIVHSHGMTAIYLADDNNILRYRLVRLGQNKAEGVEVVVGLNSGQRIVRNLDSLPQIKSGLQVVEGK